MNNYQTGNADRKFRNKTKLVLTRKEGEAVVLRMNGMEFGTIRIVEVGGDIGRRVKISLQFPETVNIRRDELKQHRE